METTQYPFLFLQPAGDPSGKLRVVAFFRLKPLGDVLSTVKREFKSSSGGSGLGVDFFM